MTLAEHTRDRWQEVRAAIWEMLVILITEHHPCEGGKALSQIYDTPLAAVSSGYLDSEQAGLLSRIVGPTPQWWPVSSG